MFCSLYIAAVLRGTSQFELDSVFSARDRHASKKDKSHLTEPTLICTGVHQDARAAPLGCDRQQGTNNAHHDEERSIAAPLHQMPVPVPAVCTRPLFHFIFSLSKKNNKGG